MQILQVFYLLDFQDLALNLALMYCKYCTKMKLFLPRNESLVLILQENNCKNFLVTFKSYLATMFSSNFSCTLIVILSASWKKSFIISARLTRYVQDLMQDLVRRILARFAYFFQEGFYWVSMISHYIYSAMIQD